MNKLIFSLVLSILIVGGGYILIGVFFSDNSILEMSKRFVLNLACKRSDVSSFFTWMVLVVVFIASINSQFQDMIMLCQSCNWKGTRLRVKRNNGCCPNCGSDLFSEVDNG